jgi:hypothetical protein
MEKNNPLQIETSLLESAIAQLEKSVGIRMTGDEATTPEGVWNTCRALYFSIPMADGNDMSLMSEEEKDRQFADWSRVSKASFLKRAEHRMNAFRRRSMKAKQVKKM